MIKIFKDTIKLPNFSILGELPIVYYVWIISLFLIQITQSTLNYKLFNKKDNFSTYILEGLLLYYFIVWRNISI